MHSPTALHVLTIVLAWLSLIPSISAGRISRWHRSKDWEDDDDCTSSTTTSETPCPETSSGWPYQTTAYSPTTTFTSGSASSSPASSVIPSCNVTVTTVTVTFEPTAPLTPTATSTCPPPNATVTVTDVTITATTITAACPTTSTSTAPPVPTTTTPPAVDYYKRNLATISAIYNLTVYPNQLPILFSGAGAVPPGLFAQNVIGRVAPVGDFRGFEDSIEYFFALAPVPQANAAMAAITHFKITEFTTGCPDLAASVVYLFCNVVDPTSPDHGKSLAPLKQVAFWKFDSAGAVLRYDAWIPNLNSWVQHATGVAVSNPQAQAESIVQLCYITQQRCTGPNQQWDSLEACIAGLSAKPYGNYDEAWGDNVVCRSIHLVLTQVRPSIHCPHVGPSGGGKCVDIVSPGDYFNDVTLYNEPLGETFVCKT